MLGAIASGDDRSGEEFAVEKLSQTKPHLFAIREYRMKEQSDRCELC